MIWLQFLREFVTMNVELSLYQLFLISNMVAFTFSSGQISKDGFNLYKDVLRGKTEDVLLVESDSLPEAIEHQKQAWPSVAGRFYVPSSAKRTINQFKNLKITKDPLEPVEEVLEITPILEDLKEVRVPFPRTIMKKTPASTVIFESVNDILPSHNREQTEFGKWMKKWSEPPTPWMLPSSSLKYMNLRSAGSLHQTKPTFALNMNKHWDEITQ